MVLDDRSTAGPGSRVVADRITSVELSTVLLPMPTPVRDAKVLTGRQRAVTEVAFLVAEVGTESGLSGMGFSFCIRAGAAAQFAHAREVAPELIGQDPSDIGRLWTRLVEVGASVGRSGVAVQAIAALDTALWDLKARRAGLPLAELLGAHRNSVRCYDSTGGYLHAPLEQVLDNVDRTLAAGMGGFKLKVGQPDAAEDLRRLRAVREHVGDGVPLMVDANQQWDRPTAARVGRAMEEFGLVWIEEPLDASDAAGLAALARSLDTPVASGEMLTSTAELRELIRSDAVDVLQPDAPRIGGITSFLQVAALADDRGLQVAPHFVLEVHVHLAAAYPLEPWVEHFDWLYPLFDERLEIGDGRVRVPDRPGLGLTLSEQARAWTVERTRVDVPR